MLKDISLGKFVDTGSILHRIDPRVKVLMYALYLVAIFMITTPAALALMGLIVLAQLLVARMPLKTVKNTVAPIIPLTIFIFLLNILTIKTGDVIWHRWKITITDNGLERASIMAVRLIFLILSTSVMLTLTTTPLKIADALERIFSPLKVIKVPVHEMAMMMSIALRFIPTLIEETDKIMKAQISRGADYDTGSFLNRIKGYVTVLVPLFVASFKRAEELAVAMDARCYRGGEGRTKLNPLKIVVIDVIVGLILAIGAVGPVVLDRVIRSL